MVKNVFVSAPSHGERGQSRAASRRIMVKIHWFNPGFGRTVDARVRFVSLEYPKRAILLGNGHEKQIQDRR